MRVVRRGDRGPLTVVEAGLRRARWIGFEEFPIGVEVQREALVSRDDCDAQREPAGDWPEDLYWCHGKVVLDSSKLTKLGRLAMSDI
jgi:hypothetical protein